MLCYIQVDPGMAGQELPDPLEDPDGAAELGPRGSAADLRRDIDVCTYLCAGECARVRAMCR